MNPCALALAQETAAGPVRGGALGHWVRDVYEKGTLTTFVWYFTRALKGGLYELIPAFAAGLIATAAVSLVTSPPDDTDPMFRAMQDEEDL